MREFQFAPLPYSLPTFVKGRVLVVPKEGRVRVLLCRLGCFLGWRWLVEKNSSILELWAVRRRKISWRHLN